ncbi:hypothetical protein DSM3645_25397 [Blastopirellula marina DSM 3645]|uniref:Uncharacterized protein n=1 Tax=Blastopirellula marina DSM 3645 TaxID=314230 RepID=A4A0E7_9BACT|nr:hypothetical protein DSM3645_25397 [Blastopirellula marina DSM 3645]
MAISQHAKTRVGQLGEWAKIKQLQAVHPRSKQFIRRQRNARVAIIRESAL